MTTINPGARVRAKLEAQWAARGVAQPCHIARWRGTAYYARIESSPGRFVSFKVSLVLNGRRVSWTPKYYYWRTKG